MMQHGAVHPLLQHLQRDVMVPKQPAIQQPLLKQ